VPTGGLPLPFTGVTVAAWLISVAFSADYIACGAVGRPLPFRPFMDGVQPVLLSKKLYQLSSSIPRNAPINAVTAWIHASPVQIRPLVSVRWNRTARCPSLRHVIDRDSCSSSMLSVLERAVHVTGCLSKGRLRQILRCRAWGQTVGPKPTRGEHKQARPRVR